MNKYHQLLAKILAAGTPQLGEKGASHCLLNEQLSLTPADLLDLFESRAMPRAKLKTELDLFMQGVRSVKRYRDAGIAWWDYCGTELIGGYPSYLKQLPALVERINREKRQSKKYVLYIGATEVESNQVPCLSLVQFQITPDGLVISAYQRSSDANLGLPADIYHLYLMSRMIDVPLRSITLSLANVHIYDNNMEATRAILAGEPAKLNLNV